MAFSTFSHLRVSGISVVVPQQKIRLEDELEYFGGSLKKVERTKKMIGLACRCVADNGVTAADLCQQAAENLFDGMAVARDSVDALIFISQGPDHAIPATACILQHKLGLAKTCAAFDVNQGCTAYTYGLWLGGALLESGACKRVLLLVGEAGARHSDPANRVITPIFGDCGSATILDYTEKPTLSWFALGTDGSGAEALMVPAGHARFPLPARAEDYARYVAPIKDANGNHWYLNGTYMDGSAIFNFTMTVVPEHLAQLLGYAGKTADDIDWLILHQANRQIAESIASKAGFPLSRAPTETVGKYGNQSGASLPSVICDQLCGDVATTAPVVLLSGYGVGLSWASAIMVLDHIWCSGVREFTPTSEPSSVAEMEAYWRNKILHTGE